MESLYPKETALTKIIYLWFDRDKSASYATIMRIIFEKMENHTDYAAAYGKSVMQGDVNLWGSCVTEDDIPKILSHVLTPAIESRIAEVNIAQIFNVEAEPGEAQDLQCVLRLWLRQEKDNATWKNLVKKMEAVDQDAATKIEELRRHGPDECPPERRSRASAMPVCIKFTYTKFMYV